MNINSIDWLVEKYTIVCGLGSKELMIEHIEKAKAMHKKEIIDAVGVGSQFDRDYLYGYHDKAEQYYKETFE